MLSASNPTEGWFRNFYEFPGIVRATDIRQEGTGLRFEWDYFIFGGHYKAHRHRLFDTYQDALDHAAQEIEEQYIEALEKAAQMIKEAGEKRAEQKAKLLADKGELG